MTKYLLLALVLGVGLTFGYLLRGRGAGDARLQDEVAVLQERVRELEQIRESDAREVRSVLATVARVAAASGRAAGEAAAQDARPQQGAPVHAPPELEAESGASDGSRSWRNRSPEAKGGRPDAYLASLDQAIEAPPTDPSWSLPALREAEAAVASTLVGSRIIEKRCGGDMCRIVVEHGPGDEGAAADGDLMQLAPFNNGGTITHTPATGHEPARSRIYISRLLAGPRGP